MLFSVSKTLTFTPRVIKNRFNFVSFVINLGLSLIELLNLILDLILSDILILVL